MREKWAGRNREKVHNTNATSFRCYIYYYILFFFMDSTVTAAAVAVAALFSLPFLFFFCLVNHLLVLYTIIYFSCFYLQCKFFSIWIWFYFNRCDYILHSSSSSSSNGPVQSNHAKSKIIRMKWNMKWKINWY